VQNTENQNSPREVYDVYLAEDTVEFGSDKLIATFLTRFDYHPRGATGTSQTTYAVMAWALGCSSQKLLFAGGVSYDSLQRVSERVPVDDKPQMATVIQGSVGQSVHQRICASRNASPNTHQAEASNQKGLSFGTAWLSDRGYFVTAFHVIEGANEIAIRSRDGKVSPAKVVATDQPNDIAILSSTAAIGLNGLPVGRSLPGLGARVFTIGYPHPDLMGVSQKLTSGDINSLSGIRDDPRLLQVSAPVQAGNSGGPLINMNGEVVGMVSAKLSATQVLSKTGDLPQNVNYAVKARYVAGLLEDLPQVGPPSTSTKALRAQPTLEDLASNAQRAIFLIVAQ
jgi:S1-C subfamily serine protease